MYSTIVATWAPLPITFFQSVVFTHQRQGSSVWWRCSPLPGVLGCWRAAAWATSPPESLNHPSGAFLLTQLCRKERALAVPRISPTLEYVPALQRNICALLLSLSKPFRRFALLPSGSTVALCWAALKSTWHRLCTCPGSSRDRLGPLAFLQRSCAAEGKEGKALVAIRTLLSPSVVQVNPYPRRTGCFCPVSRTGLLVAPSVPPASRPRWAGCRGREMPGPQWAGCRGRGAAPPVPRAGRQAGSRSISSLQPFSTAISNDLQHFKKSKQCS